MSGPRRKYIVRRVVLDANVIISSMLTDLGHPVRAKYPGLTKARIGRLKLAVIERDPDDNKVIAAAVEGEAEQIVSGDPDLTDLKVYRGIKIVTPAEFTKLLP